MQASARGLLTCLATSAGRAKTRQRAGQRAEIRKVQVMRAQTLFSAAAIALSAPLAACASNGPPVYGAPAYAAPAEATAYPPAGYRPEARPDDLLPEPPADAKPGECFAKVVVPGQPIYGPPAGPVLKWVQSPPPPGAIGPVWCQVWEQGQPTVVFTPERYGWIRVICDKDATRDHISHIQHRLHDWGYYQGGYGGEYDAATAQAVRRFQDGLHIEHGGYLSYRTLEALELNPPAQPAAAPTPYGQSYARPAYPQPAPVYPQPVYAQPVDPQPVYSQPTYAQPGPTYQQPGYGLQTCQTACLQEAPAACGPSPCQGAYGSPPLGYGYSPPPTYGAQTWLTWPGKASY